MPKISLLSQPRIRAICVPLLFAPLLANATPLYAVTTLGAPGPYSYAYGINDRGQVVGVNIVQDTAGNTSFRGFVSTNGVMQDLGSLGGTRIYPRSINNAGQVVGHSTLAGDVESRAFLYSNGAMSALDALGGSYGEANGINTAGQVAGYDYTASNAIHAYFYASGTTQNLGTLGSYWGGYSVANGLNDDGQVVGWAFTDGSASHAFLYANGKMTDLGTLGPSSAYSSTAIAINNFGQVVGYASTPNGSHAFLYANGVMSDLGTLGSPWSGMLFSESGATDINDLGDVIGYTDTSTGSHKPFLYTNGVMRDVNSLIDAASGWQINEVNSINNKGQIAANACNASGCQAVRLDLLETALVPEPQTFSLLLGGIVLLGFATRRKARKAV